MPSLCFNKICSVSRFFDNRCNQLECWLKDRGYNEKFVRQQILKAKKFTRKDLLSQDSKTKVGNKLVFNFTCHPVNSKLNARHRKVFPEVPIVGVKKGKKLGQKFQWKKKQMGNLVVARQNAAKFALF